MIPRRWEGSHGQQCWKNPIKELFSFIAGKYILFMRNYKLSKKEPQIYLDKCLQSYFLLSGILTGKYLMNSPRVSSSATLCVSLQALYKFLVSWMFKTAGKRLLGEKRNSSIHTTKIFILRLVSNSSSIKVGPGHIQRLCM